MQDTVPGTGYSFKVVICLPEAGFPVRDGSLWTRE